MKVKLPSYQVTKLLLNDSCPISSHYCTLHTEYLNPPQTVQQLVENHLHDMILKTFDPKKADAIFAEEGETPSWLAELIE